MKQATGRTNAPAAANRVSIQQSLDGRSFSVSGAEQAGSAGEAKEARAGATAAAVEAEVLTWQTLLVPVEAFDPAQAAKLLAAAGIPCTASQEAVWTPQQEEEEAVAVMALNRECRHELEERFGPQGGLVYTTPLLHIPQDADRCVWLHQTDNVLYIKVYDSTLRLAEAIPVKTEADPLYLIGRVGRLFPLREFELRTAGRYARTLRKALGRYFKSTTCES